MATKTRKTVSKKLLSEAAFKLPSKETKPVNIFK